jgi:hypothetical protein
VLRPPVRVMGAGRYSTVSCCGQLMRGGLHLVGVEVMRALAYGTSCGEHLQNFFFAIDTSADILATQQCRYNLMALRRPRST